MTTSVSAVAHWRASAAQAIHSAANLTTRIAIGEHRARLSFAHDNLAAQIMPAFGHIVDDSITDSASLDVAIWNGAEHAPPVPDWEAHHPSPNRVRATHRMLVSPEDETAWIFDEAEGWAAYWSRPHGDLTVHERAAPLRTVLHWWLQPRGMQLLHASAIASGDHAALVVGKSGAGKSTTMFAALLAGLDYLGDDFVVVAAKDEPHVHSLYNSAKIRPASLTLLPPIEQVPHLTEHGDERRSVWFVHDWLPERCRRSARISAILVPAVTGATKTMLREASPGTALLAAGPPTIIQLPGGESHALATMADLIRSVPTYHVDLGTDLAQTVDVLREVLAR